MNSTANLTKGFSIPKYDELRVSDKMGKKQNIFVYNIHTLYMFIYISSETSSTSPTEQEQQQDCRCHQVPLAFSTKIHKQTQIQRTIGNQSAKNLFSVGSKIYAVLSNCSTDVSYWFIRIIPTIIYNILYKYNIIIILYHI